MLISRMKIKILISSFSFFRTGPQTGLFGTSAQAPFGSTSAGTSTAGTGKLHDIKLTK